MPKHSKPRAGSLQFWPRKRAAKLVPRVNWKPLEEKYANSEAKPLGILGYKVGMIDVIARDEKPTSLVKGQEVVLPASIIEFAPMAILAVRFYKGNKNIKDVLNTLSLDYKWLSRKIKVSKKKKSKEELIKEIEECAKEADKIRLIIFTKPKVLGFKKAPDIFETALGGSKEAQLEWIKANIDKELNARDLLKPKLLVDVRGVTKGKGTAGPIKRFGIGRKQHKSEKGVRRPGSLGPWNPSKVRFSVPMMGQLGFFSRVEYNKYLLDVGNAKEKSINKKGGFLHYGDVKNDFAIVKGSVVGPAKRPLLITFPLRPSNKALKQNYQLVKLNY
ncbi:MAG: 50S ribosomal protein L3 [Candidatus Pacearchaeota archaeon]